VRYWLVMPAAGRGQRFGAALPKQYAHLAGRSVLEWSLSPFLSDPRCTGVRVALAAGDSHWATLGLEDPSGRLRAVGGGAQRCDSVRAGLAALPPGSADDFVLVHDAARPCVSEAERDSLLAAGAECADGALLGLPLADTLKRAQPQQDDEPPHVAATLERGGLWRAQTPQMFRVGLLSEALAACAKSGRVVTDEAQAVEALGRSPRLVPGRASNFKITTQDDLRLAAAILTLPESA
jgi:2-C-methyl-D-erythritol 4-phosphate cytidylyltransferase